VGDRDHRKGQLRVLGSPSARHTKEPRTGGPPGGRGGSPQTRFFLRKSLRTYLRVLKPDCRPPGPIGTILATGLWLRPFLLFIFTFYFLDFRFQTAALFPGGNGLLEVKTGQAAQPLLGTLHATKLRSGSPDAAAAFSSSGCGFFVLWLLAAASAGAGAVSRRGARAAGVNQIGPGLSTRY
jgi:hypothetical protein